MSETASMSQSIAGRYAQAVFDIAREGGQLPAIEADVATLEGALNASPDLRALIGSPVYSRDEQGRAITAVAERAGLSVTMRNVLGLMAGKRRLFALPQLLSSLRERIARERGEVVAEVTSARALSPAQAERLAATLSEGQGRRVQLDARVDPSLIGGLVVKLGSKMIDTSVRARLGALQTLMKEA